MSQQNLAHAALAARLTQARQAAGYATPFATALRLAMNAHWFLSLADARANIEARRRDYNESRPHTSLSWMTPVGYAAAVAQKAAE